MDARNTGLISASSLLLMNPSCFLTLIRAKSQSLFFLILDDRYILQVFRAYIVLVPDEHYYKDDKTMAASDDLSHIGGTTH